MTQTPDVTPTHQRPIARRSLLVAAGGTGTLAATQSLPWLAHAETADDFAALRSRYRDMVLGTDFDLGVPEIAAAISAIDTAASDALAKIAPGADRDRVFTDLPFEVRPGIGDGTKSARIVSTFGRLLTMGRAHQTPGSLLYGDSACLEAVLAGLRTIHDLVYHSGAEEWDNWYHWEISGPRSLLETLVVLGDLVPASDLADYAAAADWFVADPKWQFERYPNRTPLESPGSNRLYLCRNKFLIGVLQESTAAMALSADRLGYALTYAKENAPADYPYGKIGLFPDGSYLYQTTIPYTGSYGVDLLTELGALLGWLADTSLEVTDPRVARIIDAVDRGFVPVMVNGEMMDGVRGRSITRGPTSDGYDWGQSLFFAILALAPAADAQTRQRWRGICAGWDQRNGFQTYSGGSSLPRTSLLRELRADTTVTPVTEPTGLRLFPGMARAVHRGPGWACMVTAASTRVSRYDYQLGENYQGFHTSAGMTYVYLDSDPGQFADNFWPTTNLYGLPGTTVDTVPLPRGAGGGGAGNTPAPNVWAGGVNLDNRIGTFGQDHHGVASTLRVHQSWFFLADRIVALGADITGGSTHPLRTTLEERNLHAVGENALTIDGSEQPITHGWQSSFTDRSWAHLAGGSGYVLLDGPAVLRASRQERTGSWRDVNDNGSTAPITRRYVSLWLEHAQHGSYGYLLLPGATVSKTAAEAASPSVAVIANSAEVQAIRDVASGETLANFFTSAELPTITTDGPCAVAVGRANGRDWNTATIAVSDPTQLRTSVQVRVRCGGRAIVQAADSTVTVSRDASWVTVTVDTGALDGRSHAVTIAR